MPGTRNPLYPWFSCMNFFSNTSTVKLFISKSSNKNIEVSLNESANSEFDFS